MRTKKNVGGRPGKIDKKQLFHMLRAGKSASECAKHFNVSPSAISQVKKSLNLAVAANANLESGALIVRESIDSMAQLKKVNDEANKLIDLLSAWVAGDPDAIARLSSQHALGGVGKAKSAASLAFPDPKIVLLKAIAEVRAQVRLSLDIAQSLYNMQAVEEFQSTVIEVIGEQNQEVRNEIVKRLQRRRALRGAVRISG